MFNVAKFVWRSLYLLRHFEFIMYEKHLRMEIIFTILSKTKGTQQLLQEFSQ
jgi:hypothetical protein